MPSAPVDRTPKPCLHKQAQHEHGTHACYVLDKCRCVPCKDANTAYERHRNRQTVYGRWTPYVDAQPVREHMLMLRAAGLGAKRVATLSGVPHGSLAKLIYGAPERGLAPSKRVRRETAERLLAVQPALELLGATVLVDGTGTHRRLSALVAAGWSKSKLASLLGLAPSNFGRTFDSARVHAATARAVRDLYARIAFTPPPEGNQRDRIAASRARNYARTRGWHPPMWWDDADLDDPAFTAAEPIALSAHEDVDEIAVDLALSGQAVTLTIAERRVVVTRLHREGLSDGQIADRSGMADRTVLRIRQELALPANTMSRERTA